jgi:hypothetical protein
MAHGSAINGKENGEIIWRIEMDAASWQRGGGEIAASSAAKMA